MAKELKICLSTMSWVLAPSNNISDNQDDMTLGGRPVSTQPKVAVEDKTQTTTNTKLNENVTILTYVHF